MMVGVNDEKATIAYLYYYDSDRDYLSEKNASEATRIKRMQDLVSTSFAWEWKEGTIVVTISSKQKVPLFHGHVNRPGEFLFIYIMGGIVAVVIFVLLAKYVFFWAEQDEKVTSRQIVFESSFIDSGDTYRVSSDDLLFEVSGKWQYLDSLK